MALVSSSPSRLTPADVGITRWGKAEIMFYQDLLISLYLVLLNFLKVKAHNHLHKINYTREVQESQMLSCIRCSSARDGWSRPSSLEIRTYPCHRRGAVQDDHPCWMMLLFGFHALLWSSCTGYLASRGFLLHPFSWRMHFNKIYSKILVSTTYGNVHKYQLL